MGNRGILHDENKNIVAPWKHKTWVTCKLEYQGRQRSPFSPGKYSELFFIDEATAFAAGHRPCAECRRARYNEFKDAWLKANADKATIANPAISEIDKILHKERTAARGQKGTYDMPFGQLPEGALIELAGNAFLFWRKRIFLWTFSGYQLGKQVLDPSARVTVLTPRSVVATFCQGFQPQIHQSAYS